MEVMAEEQRHAKDNPQKGKIMTYNEALSLVLELAEQNALDPKLCEFELMTEALEHQKALAIMDQLDPAKVLAGKIADAAGQIVGEDLNMGPVKTCALESLGVLIPVLKQAVHNYNRHIIDSTLI